MNCIFSSNAKELMKAASKRHEHYSRLMDSLTANELLYEGSRTPDLFSENGTTYLILVLKLNEIAPLNEKVKKMPILA